MTKIMNLFYVQFLLVVVTSQYNRWKIGITKLPNSHTSYNMVCGHYNNSIWLLGDNGLVQFQPLTVDKRFTPRSYLIPNKTAEYFWKAWGYGQYWTQIQDTLYYIYGSDTDNYILSYDLATQEFDEAAKTPGQVGLYSCLASFEKFIVVIGGTGNLVYILDTTGTTSEWMRVSDMNEIIRRDHACIVASNNYLYAISGDGKGTTEKINVNGDINDIATREWIYGGNLTIDWINSRAAVYCDNILIIGGRKQFSNGTEIYNGEMLVIDTKTDTVSIGGNLYYAMWGTATINFNNILYAFDGKRDASSSLGTWQSLELVPCNTTYTVAPTSLTLAPTKLPTTSPTVSVASTVATTYNYILLSIIGIFIILAFVGLVDSKAHKNDVFRVAFIISFAVYSIDFISDIFFALNVLIEGSTIIFILSLIFILLPVILSLSQLYKGIKLWINDKETSSFVSVYMDNHTKFIYVISLLCGSGFATISLLNSGLFRMTLFDLGLKKQQITAFQNQRLYTVVLIENIPQMVLQISFIILSNGNFATITVMALIFSLFSIILSIFEYLTKKSLIQSRFGLCEVYLIAFDVVSDSIVRNRTSFRYQRKLINRGIAEILKVDLIFIEQLRSVNVSGGLTLYFRVRIQKEMDIENSMNEAIANGTVCELIRNCWKLQNIPIVKELSISKVETTATHSNIPLTKIDSENSHAITTSND